MANIVFNAVPDAVKGLIIVLVCGRKFKEHLAQRVNKRVNVFFAFEPHGLTLVGHAPQYQKV